MSEHLSSTRSTDPQDGPTIPDAHRIYGQDVPGSEDGMGAAFWFVVLVTATIVCLIGWAVFLALL